MFFLIGAYKYHSYRKERIMNTKSKILAGIAIASFLGLLTVSANEDLRNNIVDTFQPKGSLQITAEPGEEQVTIYIDGEKKGETPLEVKRLDIGKHTLKVFKEGYKEYFQEFEVEEKKVTTIHVNFAAKDLYTDTSNEIMVFLEPSQDDFVNQPEGPIDTAGSDIGTVTIENGNLVQPFDSYTKILVDDKHDIAKYLPSFLYNITPIENQYVAYGYIIGSDKLTKFDFYEWKVFKMSDGTVVNLNDKVKTISAGTDVTVVKWINDYELLGTDTRLDAQDFLYNAKTQKISLITREKDLPDTSILPTDPPKDLPPDTSMIEPSAGETHMSVKLYYKNTNSDPKMEDCSANDPIEIQIPTSKTALKDTINFLISNRLREDQIAMGYDGYLGGSLGKKKSTNFKLKSAVIQGDTAVLTFDDPDYFASGGSCAMGILTSQIEKTALQFPSVKKVQLLPEDRFQP